MKKYAIIGSGPAGTVAAETLRKLDENSEITIVTAEGLPFYRREHITGLISGDETEEELFERGKDFHERIKVALVTGRVTQVSTGKDQLKLGDGSTINYDSLLIASGGKPILPPWPGVELEGVSTLYTLDGAKKVAKLSNEATDVLVIGAGTIAMKLVPLLRRIGLKVTMSEKTDRLWPTMFDRKASKIVEGSLSAGGAELLLNDEVVELEGKGGKVQSAILKSGKKIPCDLVLVTMGIRASVDFLKDSGIQLDQGVLTDHHLRTNVPNVYAAGDAAQVPDPVFGVPMLHPTWGYAEEQGEIAAYNMAAVERVYRGAVPLFSMNVNDIGVVAAGITRRQADFEEVSRFSPHDCLYRKFVLRGSRLVGVILMGKRLDRKLKRPIKEALLKMADVGTARTDLLKEDFDFNSLLGES